MPSMTAYDWEHMPYFLAVVRGGSFRAAANELRATHGTVSRHIDALEKSYGSLLFQRTRSGPKLTPAGQSLVPLAQEAEVIFRRARRQVQGHDSLHRGAVRVSLTGVMAYELVAPIFARYAVHYPDIDLQIHVSDAFADINRLQTDVSLRYAKEIDVDVVARILLTMSLGIYASREYVERFLPEASPEGHGLSWIGWGEIDHHPGWVENSRFPRAVVRHATTDHVMQIALARHGVGMIRTTPFFAQRFPELIQVPGTVLTPDRPLWLLLHEDLRQTARVRSLVDFLASELGKMRPLLEAG